MLATAYNTLVDTLLGILGMSVNTPEVVQFWVCGFSIVATLFVAVLPFIIVYKVVRWLFV